MHVCLEQVVEHLWGELHHCALSEFITVRAARGIYLHVVKDGWESALAKYKPKPIEEKIVETILTVGLFIKLAIATGSLGASGRSYAAKLRTIVAAICGFGAGNRKGVKVHEWRAKVDEQPLSVLSEESVQRFKQAFLSRSLNDRSKHIRAQHSFDSLLRHGRRLFSEEIRAAVQVAHPEIVVPASPFKNVKFATKGGKSSYRYIPTFSAEQMIKDTLNELAESRPAEFLIFVLAIVLGLRRNEIDKLRWFSIDWEQRVLRVVEHEWFTAKTPSSYREMALDPGTLLTLRTYFGQARGPWVIPVDREVKLSTTYHRYRCEPEFKRLCGWLRGKGINANCPIHTLRKEAGSRICQKFGPIAAQHFLGHSDPQTTLLFYAGDSRTTHSGLGKLLAKKREPDPNGAHSAA